MKTLLQSSYLYEIELLKSKLASRNIESFIKNEFVNNVAVFPITQNYELLVNEDDFQNAVEVQNEEVDLDDFGN
jgi:hypothetical protein